MGYLKNPAVFVALYILFMVPTYYLPYLGSNSFILQGMATGAGINPAFWPHFGSLLVLVALAWFRGLAISGSWLVIFPVLAGVFDLIPVLSSILLVPTVMHLLAIIRGMTPLPTTARVLAFTFLSIGAPSGLAQSQGTALPPAQYRMIPYGAISLARENECPSRNDRLQRPEHRWETVAGYIANPPDFGDNTTAHHYLRAGYEYFVRTCLEEIRRHMPAVRSVSVAVFLSSTKQKNRYGEPTDDISSSSALIRAVFDLEIGDPPETAKISRYYNPAAAERQRVARAGEDERPRQGISRVIEGFALGADRESVLLQLRRGWNREYLPYSLTYKDVDVPMWFNQRKSGTLTRLPLTASVAIEGTFFRTGTTRWIALYFYDAKLYQIVVATWAGTSDRNKLVAILTEKYGTPRQVPGDIPLFPTQGWSNASTQLRLLTMGTLKLEYTDVQLARRIDDAEKKRQRALREDDERRRKVLPKGY